MWKGTTPIYRSRSSEGKHADTPIRPSPHPSPTPPSPPHDLPVEVSRKGNTPIRRSAPHPTPAQPHPAHPTIYRSRSSEGKHADTPIRPSPHPSPTPPSPPHDLPVEVLGRETRRYADPPLTPPQPHPAHPTIYRSRSSEGKHADTPIRPSPHPSPTPPSPPHDLPVEVLGRETRRYADPPLTPPQPNPTIYRSRSSEGKNADTPIRPSPHLSPTPPSPPHDLPVEVLAKETLTRRYADPPLTPPQPNPTQPTPPSPPTTPFKIRTPTTPELRGWSFGLMGHHADVRRSIREIRRYAPLAVRGVTVYRWCLGAQLFWGRCLLALCVLAQDRGSPPMEA